uniref:Notch ligand N-terminal domain-containing protein n=1 Tax=Anopheles merus TaxID=30066 RepID=A0A182VFK2_ANOME
MGGTFFWPLLDMIHPVRSSVSSSGFFELQILEISNTNSHLLSGYCCGLPPEKRQTQTTAFSLCLKEYQGTTSSVQQQQQLKQPAVAVEPQPSGLYGCAFGNASTPVLGGSSFVLTDPEVGGITLPFTFRWTLGTVEGREEGSRDLFIKDRRLPTKTPSTSSSSAD